MIGRRWMLMGTGGGLLGNSCSEKLPVEFGDMDVVAVDLAGRVIPGASAELYRGKERFGLRNVGYGRYRLEVEAPWGVRVIREITLAQRQMTVRVGIDIDIGCSGRPAIHGQIRGMRAGEPYWVKAVPVRGVGGEEVKVDGGGTFVIPGLMPGDYIVLVLHRDAVVAHAAVRTYPVSEPVPEVRIDLPGVTK